MLRAPDVYRWKFIFLLTADEASYILCSSLCALVFCFLCHLTNFIPAFTFLQLSLPYLLSTQEGFIASLLVFPRHLKVTVYHDVLQLFIINLYFPPNSNLFKCRDGTFTYLFVGVCV